MTVRKFHPCVLLLSGALAIGCNSDSGKPSGDSHDDEAGHSAADHVGHADHDHPSAGPHGGELIELGSEEYHAELMHDNQIVVYLLDSAAKAAAPSEASEVTVNVNHDGKGEQFKLTADPDANDPQGKSSRYSSQDAELLKDVQEGHAEVTLVVSINGKQFRGALEHDHEHDEEGHAH